MSVQGQTIAFPDPLVRMLEQLDLCLVDVGARGNPPEPARRLAQFVRMVAVEPDALEAQRLRNGLSKWPWRSTTVLAEAIGPPPTATLHVTAHPGFSSLLPPDPSIAARYKKTQAAMHVRKTERVPTIGLDAAAARYGFRDASWLKLDTQGSELMVLETGEALLRSVVAVQTEAEFQPLYVSQPMFGDVDAYLRSRGFVLVDMSVRFIRGSGFDKTVYSRRQPLSAHCLYLRAPEALGDVSDPPRSLGRYVAMTLAYDHHDLLLRVLGRGPSAAILRDAYGEELLPAVREYVRGRTARKAADLTPAEAKKLRKGSERAP